MLDFAAAWSMKAAEDLERVGRATIAAALLLAAGCDAAGIGNNQAGPVANATLTAAPVSPPPAAAASSGEYRCPAPLTWGILGQPAENARFEPIRNRISLDAAGTIYWNGDPVDAGTLRQYLDIVGTISPQPELHLETDPATPCDRIIEVVAMFGNAVDCTRQCSYDRRPFDRSRMRELAAPARAAEQALNREGDITAGDPLSGPPAADMPIEMEDMNLPAQGKDDDKPRVPRP